MKEPRQETAGAFFGLHTTQGRQIVSHDFEEIRDFWKKALGERGSHYLLVVALADLDRGQGATANAVANCLQVSSSFVLMQSKLLEKTSFITCRSEDAVTTLFLTEKARKYLQDTARQKHEEW